MPDTSSPMINTELAKKLALREPSALISARRCTQPALITKAPTASSTDPAFSIPIANRQRLPKLFQGIPSRMSSDPIGALSFSGEIRNQQAAVRIQQSIAVGRPTIQKSTKSKSRQAVLLYNPRASLAEWRDAHPHRRETN